MELALRTRSFAASRTSGTRNRAKELASRGVDVINLAAGELDREPPSVLLDALASLPRLSNRYTDTAGIPELRAAIAARASAATGRSIPLEQIVVTAGAKQALFLAAMVLFGPGDEVLIPTPAWGTLNAQVELVGAKGVSVPTGEAGYLPDPTLLERYRTSATKGLILNTPNNPTGAVYPAELLRQLAQWARQHDLWIVFDESYADLVFSPATHSNPAGLVPSTADRIVTVGSFSKSFAVTGWRVGWLQAPELVVRAVVALQSHLTSHAPSALQHALLPAALGRVDGFIAETIHLQRRRLEVAEKEIAQIPSLRAHRPDGTFYLWLDCQDLVGTRYLDTRIDDDLGLTTALVEHAGVACVAGSAFQAPGFLRLSLTSDEQLLSTAFQRIGEFADRVT